jgi:hypothetical protein
VPFGSSELVVFLFMWQEAPSWSFLLLKLSRKQEVREVENLPLQLVVRRAGLDGEERGLEMKEIQFKNHMPCKVEQLW